MDKKTLRSNIRQQKKTHGADKLLKQSKPLTSRLTANDHYKNANIVMLYYPLWDEPDTRDAIKTALNQRKHVILPTVIGNDIIPVEINKDTKWAKGPFGIMEPQAQPYNGPINFILIPGVAFDRKLNRLGRGKGYYDRFLAKHTEAYRLGICFDFQIIQNIPVEPFDLPMNELLTL